MENQPKIRRLTCAVCGSSTKGRQWYNRDTGFGVCPSCIVWIKSKNNYDSTPEQIKSLYGIEGTHYNLEG